MSSSPLPDYKVQLIEHAMKIGALKFGTFKLKSGRDSPYFFNAGLLCSGPILATLAHAYAATIIEAQSPQDAFPKFEVLFGPAYKGIPFASTTALTLYTEYQVEVGFAYDRKEVKVHGEGGKIIGVSVQGKKVVILDDVMTSGKAVRGAIELVKEYGGEPVGVIQALDREEVGQDAVTSTVKEIEQILGVGRVRSILKMRDLMVWLERNGMETELKAMYGYQKLYGVKD